MITYKWEAVYVYNRCLLHFTTSILNMLKIKILYLNEYQCAKLCIPMIAGNVSSLSLPSRGPSDINMAEHLGGNLHNTLYPS